LLAQKKRKKGKKSNAPPLIANALLAGFLGLPAQNGLFNSIFNSPKHLKHALKVAQEKIKGDFQGNFKKR